jgi:hypothetical protein
MPFLRSFLLDSKNALSLKIWHRFINVVSTFFVVKFRSNEKAKGANGCEKMELLSSIDFP